MKLARIALHTVFGALVFSGLVGTAGAATSAKSNSSNKSTSSSSSSSTGSSNSQSSAAGIQIYTAKSALQYGTVLQLDGTSASTVKPATYAAMKQMYGVAVDPNILPLTITEDSVANQTYVATNGTYKVLVDTQNGTIKDGDYVTMSAVDGVAMKAGTYDQQAMVLGRAVSGFDGKASVIGTTTLKKSNGGTDATVQIGVVSVSINIQRNPNDKSTKTNLPPVLQKVGQEIAQRQVSPVRADTSSRVGRGPTHSSP